MPDLSRRPGLALVTALVLVSGCSLLPEEEDGTVLEVWMMNHSTGERFIDDAVEEFEAAHDGVEVRVTVQEWGGIGEKVTDALLSGDGPDVIEVGNTQVAQYVESGGVMDLTHQVVRLSGDDWLPGLADPGQVQGHQYGIPFYGANRVVVHRTDLFEEAGISDPPRDRAEWLEITEQLDQPPGQQGIYLPGQNWYVLAGFIWDEGGELAVENNGVWRGSLDTDEAEAGMDFYQRLHELGDAPADTDEANPPHEEVFAAEEVAQMITTPGSAQAIIDANPELADRLGFFPVPGKERDEPGVVFTGGSNLIISKATRHRETAFAFVEQLTSDKWQTRLATSQSLVPNRTGLGDVVRDDPGAAAMATAAVNGRATPESPRWGEVEADNPVKSYQTQVLGGADPADAGKAASDAITALLADRRPSGD